MHIAFSASTQQHYLPTVDFTSPAPVLLSPTGTAAATHWQHHAAWHEVPPGFGTVSAVGNAPVVATSLAATASDI